MDRVKDSMPGSFHPKDIGFGKGLNLPKKINDLFKNKKKRRASDEKKNKCVIVKANE